MEIPIAPTTTRWAVVRGNYLAGGFRKPFRARIELEARADGIYYWWRAQGPAAAFLGARGMLVSNRILPLGVEPFESALSHAIEGLRRKRVGRQRVYEVVAWSWTR